MTKLLRQVASTFKASVLLMLSIFMLGLVTPGEAATFTCGSQGYEEVEIHCELVKAVVEAKTSHRVQHISNLGSSLVSLQAGRTGDIDFFPTFTGTLFLGPLEMELKPGVSSPSQVWDVVHKEALARWNLWTFGSFGYNNVYAVAVPQATANRYNLKTISDLAPYASNWQLGMDPTFMDYPGQGYKELTQMYGFRFRRAVAMNYGIMYRAIDRGEVDAIVAYSTDGRIPQLNLVVLEDDKFFNPPYYGMIVANNDVLKKHPELKQAIEVLEGSIDTPTMQRLNERASVDQDSPRRIAVEFLREKGII